MLGRGARDAGLHGPGAARRGPGGRARGPVRVRGRPGDPCAGGDQQAAALWWPARRAAVEQAFGRAESSGSPVSARVAATETELGSWLARYRNAYRTACIAATRAGAEPAESGIG